jgi:lysozyme family protein
MTDLKTRNAERWANAKVTRNFSGIAKALIASKARYQAVEAKTGVPWFVIAVIHERESSQNWGRSLAQGDPWNRVSIRVPAGRGPFTSWEAAAIDALVNCHPYLAKHKDWSAGGLLTALEKYNGIGYASRGKPSPYVWAGTNQYSGGKFVADHVFDPNHVDSQPGCAGMLKAMMALDPSIKIGGAPVSTTKKVGGSVAAGGAAATAAHQSGLGIGWIIGIGIAVAVAAFLIWRFKK